MTTDPVQLLIDAGAIPASPFASNSRYYGVPLARYIPPGDENGVPYVLRRFIPQARAITIAFEHIVQSGERPDSLANTTLGDPELYWRICDANAVIDPFEVTDEPGTHVGIPLPPGF